MRQPGACFFSSLHVKVEAGHERMQRGRMRQLGACFFSFFSIIGTTTAGTCTAGSADIHRRCSCVWISPGQEELRA